MEIKESDIVLCTVKKVEGTTVFVDISNTKIPGTISFPEIAAGRIRNIRDYVSPNKKIVCKVLKSGKDHLELTLRRVTAKERESVLEKNKKESTFKKLISSITKSSEEVLEKISSVYDLSDFIEEAKESLSLLSKYFSSSEAQKIHKILSEKSEKAKTIKKTFSLKSTSSSGLSEIKSLLSPYNSQISYLGSSNFSLTLSAPNYKDAEAQALSILENIEKKAKAKSLKFESKDKK